ncbi:MAG: ABC transporter ATP-binding protein [Fimbriimonadaceae bacterium]
MSGSAEASVRCVGLACGYPERRVLDGIDLHVRPGEVLALLGPNGSGKSTLLKTIAKTLPPLGGRVEVCGRDVGHLDFAELARLLAFVPQEEPLSFAFTVRQVVLMGRMPHSEGLLDTPEDHAAAEEAMGLAGCLEIAERPVTQLSGGEKQRVLIARALAQKAPVLLMDEPTSHMDIGHQMAAVRLVREQAARGACVVAAVHDLNLAALVATDGCLLHRGSIVRQGPIGDVLTDGVLEDVYEVRFERHRDAKGRVRLFPLV